MLSLAGRYCSWVGSVTLSWAAGGLLGLPAGRVFKARVGYRPAGAWRSSCVFTFVLLQRRCHGVVSRVDGPLYLI